MLEHNIETLRELESYTNSGQNCCVVNPCGSGKTSVMTEYIKDNPGKSIVVFTKQKNAREYYINRDEIYRYIEITTYSRMRKDVAEGRFDRYDADIYILDEAHYIGAEKWNEAFDILYDRFKPIVVGFTATPQRFTDQGTDETIVTRYFNGHSAGNYTASDLQRAGVFMEPEYILSLYNLSSEIEERLEKIGESDLTDGQKKNFIDRLKRIEEEWESTSRPEIVLKSALPGYMYKPSCNRILVYMPTIAYINNEMSAIERMIQGIFPDKAIKSYRYTIKDSEDTLKEFMAEDSTYIKLLFSVDKIMETIHIDDLSITIMLRPSVSNRIITQQFGRVNSIGNKNKALIVDMVNNLSNVNSVNFLGSVGMGNKINDKNHGISFNICHMMKYKHLFEAIDSAFIKSAYYTYENVTDTLSNLCLVFCRNYEDAKRLIKEEGLSIDEAFKRLPEKNSNITQDIFDGNITIPEFTLTEEQKEIAANHYSTVDRYCARKGIVDEDLRQDLYLVMLYAISRYHGDRVNISGFIQTSLSAFRIRKMRYERLRKRIVDEDCVIEDIADTTDLIDIYLTDEMRNSILPGAVASLGERLGKIITLRFGFSDKPMTLEEVAKVIGVTRERIRQQEAKALRKLRHPQRLIHYKYAKDYLSAYDGLEQGVVRC